MAEVTGIQEVRPGVDRYRILVDDEKVGTLSARDISDLRIHVGADIDESAMEMLLQASARLSAYDRGIMVLAHGARSTADLRRRLIRKGEDKSAVLWALDKLEQNGFLGDDAYAIQFTRSRLARGAAPGAILGKLLASSVSRTIAESAIAQVVAEDGWDESGAVHKAAAKKIRTLRGLSPVAAQNRLIGFLRRRGFSSIAIRDALKALRDESQSQ